MKIWWAAQFGFDEMVSNADSFVENNNRQITRVFMYHGFWIMSSNFLFRLCCYKTLKLDFNVLMFIRPAWLVELKKKSLLLNSSWPRLYKGSHLTLVRATKKWFPWKRPPRWAGREKAAATVVVLKTGLGLKTGHEATFSRSLSTTFFLPGLVSASVELDLGFFSSRLNKTTTAVTSATAVFLIMFNKSIHLCNHLETLVRWAWLQHQQQMTDMKQNVDHWFENGKA